jgi:ATP-dependent DNA helicase RecG
MYNRKRNTYAEHKIFPYVTTQDLRMDLMDKVRNLAKSKNPDHSWLEMSDEEILKSAGLWEKDFSSGIQVHSRQRLLLKKIV